MNQNFSTLVGFVVTKRPLLSSLAPYAKFFPIHASR